jgi:hypothetical protein
MIGPSVQTKQTVEQIYSIRVHHETEGNVTLMNIKRTSSLRDVRAHLELRRILQDRTFEFLRPNGSVVAPQDEGAERALAYVPAVSVRTVSEAEAEKASIIVCRHATGEEFLTTRVPVHYTFANLLDDAANFWDVPVDCAVLKDADGFSWAENISVLKLLRSSNRPSTIFLHEEYAVTASGRGGIAPQWTRRRGGGGGGSSSSSRRAAPRSDATADSSGREDRYESGGGGGSVTATGSLRLKRREDRAHRNPLLVSAQDTSPLRAQRQQQREQQQRQRPHNSSSATPAKDRYGGGRLMITGGEAARERGDYGYDDQHHHHHGGDDADGGGGSAGGGGGGGGGGVPVQNVDNKLFSIFTYHCVRGNSLHPDRMMFRQVGVGWVRGWVGGGAQQVWGVHNKWVGCTTSG